MGSFTFHNKRATYLGETDIGESIFGVDGERYTFLSGIHINIATACHILIEKLLGIHGWSEFVFENRNTSEMV